MKMKIIAAGFLAATLSWTGPASAEDDREAIYLSAEQRDYVLLEMREFLIAVQDIVLGLAENDMLSVAEAARSRGLGQGQNQGQGVGLNRALPLGFRQMGRGTHMAFSELAQAAEFGSEGVLEDLGTLMSNCTACHSSYRLVVK